MTMKNEMTNEKELSKVYVLIFFFYIFFLSPKDMIKFKSDFKRLNYFIIKNNICLFDSHKQKFLISRQCSLSTLARLAIQGVTYQNS